MRTSSAAALSLAAAAALGVGVLVGTQQQVSTHGAQQGYPPGALPDPRLTPGEVLTTDAKVICVSGYAGRTRAVSEAEKRAVYAEYHATRGSPPAEADHLISLELGGSNSLKNLFPQPWHINWNGRDCGARVKDVLEGELHREVCSGKLPLAQAQAEIRRDWIAAYQRHIGPLPAFPFGKDTEPERP